MKRLMHIEELDRYLAMSILEAAEKGVHPSKYLEVIKTRRRLEEQRLAHLIEN